mmetsp:Transcript_29309/g.86843  ORF Transcript_29309/g.86843 Transcript_29309/m.86843 type:complete len:90 (-) Transcript_29309:1194-1463(-)
MYVLVGAYFASSRLAAHPSDCGKLYDKLTRRILCPSPLFYYFSVHSPGLTLELDDGDLLDDEDCSLAPPAPLLPPPRLASWSAKFPTAT